MMEASEAFPSQQTVYIPKKVASDEVTQFTKKDPKWHSRRREQQPEIEPSPNITDVVPAEERASFPPSQLIGPELEPSPDLVEKLPNLEALQSVALVGPEVEPSPDLLEKLPEVQGCDAESDSPCTQTRFSDLDCSIKYAAKVRSKKLPIDDNSEESRVVGSQKQSPDLKQVQFSADVAVIISDEDSPTACQHDELAFASVLGVNEELSESVDHVEAMVRRGLTDCREDEDISPVAVVAAPARTSTTRSRNPAAPTNDKDVPRIPVRSSSRDISPIVIMRRSGSKDDLGMTAVSHNIGFNLPASDAGTSTPRDTSDAGLRSVSPITISLERRQSIERRPMGRQSFHAERRSASCGGRSVSPLVVPQRRQGANSFTNGDPRAVTRSPDISFPRPLGMASSLAKHQIVLAPSHDMDSSLSLVNVENVDDVVVGDHTLAQKQQRVPQVPKLHLKLLETYEPTVKPASPEFHQHQDNTIVHWPRLHKSSNAPSLQEAQNFVQSATLARRKLLLAYEENLENLQASLPGTDPHDASNVDALHWQRAASCYNDLADFVRSRDHEEKVYLNDAHIHDWPVERRESLRIRCASIGLPVRAFYWPKDGLRNLDWLDEAKSRDCESSPRWWTPKQNLSDAPSETLPKLSLSDALSDTLNTTWQRVQGHAVNLLSRKPVYSS